MVLGLSLSSWRDGLLGCCFDTRSDWRLGSNIDRGETLYVNDAIRSLECVVVSRCVVVVVLLSKQHIGAYGSYLVDPASSHMLVSKIKPCMSKYKPLHGETANGSLNQKLFI